MTARHAEERCSWCNYPLPSHSDICHAYHELLGVRSPTPDMTARHDTEARRLVERLAPFLRHTNDCAYHRFDKRDDVCRCGLEPIVNEITKALGERAAVVAWLRNDATGPKRDLDDAGNELQEITIKVMMMLADAIESGAHLTESPKP